MGIGDSIKHTAEELAGKAKEAAGKVTNNDKLVAEGKADQAKADVKQTADNVKDKLTGDK
ncbi:CsbD family protein [Microbacterium sp. P01]|uniref:CsbD family protein n=1 Tax=unclassified Microbacterium TaxID=2609290 RepID=UPI00366B58BB